jgi:hypothetical protein
MDQTNFKKFILLSVSNFWVFGEPRWLYRLTLKRDDFRLGNLSF